MLNRKKRGKNGRRKKKAEQFVEKKLTGEKICEKDNSLVKVEEKNYGAKKKKRWRRRRRRREKERGERRRPDVRIEE